MTTNATPLPAWREKFREPTVAERLDALEAVLRDVLHAGEPLGDDALRDLAHRLSDLTEAAVQVLPHEVPACVAKLRRARDLYDQLVMHLTLERNEAAAKLRRLRQGKRTLRAYGQSI